MNEKVCLECTLLQCDDKARACKYRQITRDKVVRRKRLKRLTYSDSQIKRDLLAILNQLVEEKHEKNLERI